MAQGEPWVLGISNSHNGAVCLLHGDRIEVAIQEERLTRRKRHLIHGSLPTLAINYCLDYAGIKASDLSLVVSSVVGKWRALDDV
ncbi:MAG TPA: carbamoyltransferase N-terminal domain-containing protein, partial [Thermoanaerobaculia bacterium]|nr:carbamoyltransferase N-terminal domain-containing protein [Thermoanaerobaculia bacterium]